MGLRIIRGRERVRPSVSSENRGENLESVAVGEYKSAIVLRVHCLLLHNCNTMSGVREVESIERGKIKVNFWSDFSYTLKLYGDRGIGDGLRC